MRRNPALTFSGALRILDKYESKTVRRLDKALGGITIAAGAGAVLDQAASRVGPADRKEWRRIRTRLLGEVLEDSRADGGMSDTSLIEMMTWMNSAYTPRPIRRGELGPGRR